MDDIVNPLLLKVKKASPMYPGTGCKYRRGLRVPGCPHHQQADQHRGCSQTREEACVHCVQQSDGAFVYLNSGSCSVLCCTIRKSSSVIGCKLETLFSDFLSITAFKLLSIKDHSDQPLQHMLTSTILQYGYLAEIHLSLIIIINNIIIIIIICHLPCEPAQLG